MNILYQKAYEEEAREESVVSFVYDNFTTDELVGAFASLCEILARREIITASDLLEIAEINTSNLITPKFIE
jgi:hypothetical protein